MNQKELRKLSRKELLAIMLEQSKKIDELNKELDKKDKIIKKKMREIKTSGSLAEASLKLNNIFADADKAAQEYLKILKKQANEKKKEQQKGNKNEKKGK